MNKPSKNQLIRISEEEGFSLEDVEDAKISCDFIECKNDAVLEIESFLVCVEHGFRLIECLTIKMKDDTDKKH